MVSLNCAITRILAVALGIDEPDYGGKEKLKSLSAVTRELITEEPLYLQSLECIANVRHTFF